MYFIAMFGAIRTLKTRGDSHMNGTEMLVVSPIRGVNLDFGLS